MSTTYTDTQVMMTLAALAATGATPRPSGETPAAQQARIASGIAAQLANTGLATQGNWTLIWVGLTQSGANLAYIAQGPSAGTYALVLRGTVGGSPIDTAEDMHVGLMLPFAAGGTSGKISQGAMEAFTDIVMGTDLIAQLQALDTSPTLYVVGHSLGGAMVTTVSLYLVAGSGMPASSVLPYTFAAPTAGDQAFADRFDSVFPHAVCTINQYDLVPNAWATLASLPENYKSNPFFPGAGHSPKWPGPTATPVNPIGIVIGSVAKGTNGNAYAQPTLQPALNSAGQVFLSSYPSALTEMQQFEAQVGYQHANNTYLTLLTNGSISTPTLPPLAPVVASVSPASGSVAGGTTVTITPPGGMSFTQDCVVDFGIVALTSCTVAQDGSSITVTSPAGVGTVDIRVTNMFGTSPAMPVYPNLTGEPYSDQFTYTAS